MNTASYDTYEKIIQRIRQQYRKADGLGVDENGRCLYRHETNGVGCGLGCLFSRKFAFWLDGRSTTKITSLWDIEEIRKRMQEQSLGEFSDIAFLEGIQRAHDTAGSISEFMNQLALLEAAKVPYKGYGIALFEHDIKIDSILGKTPRIGWEFRVYSIGAEEDAYIKISQNWSSASYALFGAKRWIGRHVNTKRSILDLKYLIK